MYDREHMLLQWTAYFRAGVSNTADIVEQVVGSLRFSGGDLQSVDNDETLLRIVPTMTDYWQSQEARIPVSCFLTTLKWNRIGRDGRYTSAAETRQVDLPGVGGAMTMNFPTQIAWATTWTTDFRRGRAHAGRTYWPTGETLFGQTSQFSQPQCQAKANADYQLIGDLHTAIRPDSDSNMSAMVMSNIGEGESRLIKGCKVGSRPDVQRRRARSIAEGYAEAPQVEG